MKLRVYSDIHQEIREMKDDYFKIKTLPNENEQVLILSGDYDQINRYNKPFKNDTERFDAFKALCARFKYVIYVFGNHEYYQGKIGKAYSDKNLEFSRKIDNLYILSRHTPSVTIDRVKFVGATLWTKLAQGQTLDKFQVNDVSKITQVYQGSFSKLSKTFWNEENELDLAWIKKEVAESELPVVVVSHHAPILIDDPRDQQNKWLYHNCNSLEDYILNENKIIAWIFGHVHQSNYFETHIGNTLVFSNTISSHLPEDDPIRSVLTIEDNFNVVKSDE